MASRHRRWLSDGVVVVLATPPSRSRRVAGRLFSSQNTAAPPMPFLIAANTRTNLIFGANTDVGKTVVSAGLVRASLARAPSRGETNVHYIKPLQCGGSDQAFVEKHVRGRRGHHAEKNLHARTLFRWDTPTSPHLASMREHLPCSDRHVLTALQRALSDISHRSASHYSNNNNNNGDDDACAATASSSSSVTYIETAGGVLSPSSASPDNTAPRHATTAYTTATDDDDDDSSSCHHHQQQQQQQQQQQHWGWTLQADLYQPLVGHAPVVLVGDGRLGGIGCTLSALESLVLRGYDVAALVLLETTTGTAASNNKNNNYINNIAALREHVSGRRAVRMRSGSGEVLFATPSQSMLSLPPIPVDPAVPLHDWYESDRVVDTFARLDDHLQNSWEGQVSDLRSMFQTGSGRGNAVWWPFHNHNNNHNNTDPNDTTMTLIDSAVGQDFQVVRMHATSNTLERVTMVDASASGWTQGVGHGESSMALAAAAAAGRYGHVAAPSGGNSGSGGAAAAAVMHAPAVALAQALTGSAGPGHTWASRVFFTDDGGSAAVEVAIKMGLRTYRKRMGVSSEEAEKIDWIVCAQEDCYHGDTLGAMNVAESYTDREHAWYQQKSLCLATPTLGYRKGKLSISFPEGMQPSDDVRYEFDSIKQVMDVSARSLTKLLSLYKEMIEMQWLVHEHRTQQKIGSVIIEPILQCAGGMKFVDPLWQRAMIEVAESRSIPVIFDESTTGLHRLGVLSCHEILQRKPDIAIFSKLLTGGLVPLSVTMTSEEVFEAFSKDEVQQSLLNGNTFVAGPVACVSALQALSTYNAVLKNENDAKASSPRLLFDEEQAKRLSELSCVEQSFTLGTVLTVTLRSSEDGDKDALPPYADRIVRRLKSEGILAGQIGDVVYIMTYPLTKREECVWVADLLYNAIQQLGDELK